MKIAILGGSFDPPHLGHFLVTRQILDYRKDIDKIFLMPVFKHQWKPCIASVEQRMAMLKFFVDKNIELSQVELKRKGISYTADTLKSVKVNNKDTIYWIVGSDILSEFHLWEKTEELLKLATFLVFPRDPYHLPKEIPQGFEVLKHSNLITTNISSTIIRERIKNGQSIRHLVPKEVGDYIIKNGLYR